MKMVSFMKKTAFFLLCCASALLPLLYDLGGITLLFMRAFKIISALFIIMCFAYILSSKRTHRVIKGGKLLLLLSLLFIFISTVKFIKLFAEGENPSFFTAIEIPLFAMFCFSVYALLCEEKQYVSRLVKIFIIVTTATIIFFPNRFMVDDYEAYRFVGIYLNPNSASLFFFVACFFSLYLASSATRFRWLFASLFSINAGAIILTSSRSGMIALLIGCIVVGFSLLFPKVVHFSFDIRKKLKGGMCIYALALMMATIIILWPDVQDKSNAFKLTSDGKVVNKDNSESEIIIQNGIQTTDDLVSQDNQGFLGRFAGENASSSLTYRFEIWNEYLKIMPNYFWLGTDFQQSDRPILYSVPKVTHNTYLYIFYTYGIFAVLGLLAMTFFLVYRFIRKRKKHSIHLYLFAILSGLVLFSLLHDLLPIPVYWFLIGLMFATLQRDTSMTCYPRGPERVLQIIPSLDKGGAESRTLDIYRGCDRNIIQFDFLILGVRQEGVESYFYCNEIRSLGGNVFGIKSWHEIGIVEYLRQWKEILRNGHYQIVHSHSSIWSGCDLFPAWLNGVPNRIAHARDSGLVPNPSRKLKVTYHILRLLTNILSTEKIYCSHEAADFAFGKYGYRKSNSYFLPNAIDLARFAVKENENIKEELGINEDEIIIGTVGNARPVKNHIFLVKAFHCFLNDIPQAKLLIVGRDDEDVEAKEYVKTHGIKNKVIFTGQRQDIPDILSVMNLFVLPSFKEGAPGVVIEAQAANVPCILSDSITRDVDVGTGLLKYVSLNDSLDIWAKEMLTSCKTNLPSREDTLKRLRSSGYDVTFSREKLLTIYGLC